MARLHRLVILAALIASPVSAQSLTDADIEKAIALGDKKFGDYVADSTPGLYNVYVFGRLARVAYEASKAKKEYRAFTVADVAEELRRDEVRINVVADTPVFNTFTGYTVAAPIRRIVLKSKSGEIIQPIDIVYEPREWTNAVGGRLEGHDAVARFPTVPTGDFDVILILDAGREDRYAFKGKNRNKIQ